MSLKHKRIRYRRLWPFLIYVCIGIVGITFLSFHKIRAYDSIVVNRLVHSIEKNWDHLDLVEDVGYAWAVFDQSEKLRYISDTDKAMTRLLALQNGDLILTIRQKDNIVGSVIVDTHTHQQKMQLEMAHRNAVIFTFTYLIGCIPLWWYSRYLKRQIVEPFEKMEMFMKEVACGNLDEPLVAGSSVVFDPIIQNFEVMRDELRSLQQREFEANKSKKELVASLSHEIKNPVASIQLSLEVMMVKAKDEEMRHQLELILGKTEQINHLVSDLFHYTLDDLTELGVTPNECLSTELVRCIEEADSHSSVKKIMIPDCMISIDLIRMKQVFENIIYNSYKYANTEIDIIGRIESDNLIITVKDFGEGVSEEELPLIFNKLYRGKNAENKTGSGLGLYVCKLILERTDGEIYCRNCEDGFETIILLPLVG